MARYKIINSNDGTNSPWRVIDTTTGEVVTAERNRANARAAMAEFKRSKTQREASSSTVPEPAEAAPTAKVRKGDFVACETIAHDCWPAAVVIRRAVKVARDGAVTHVATQFAWANGRRTANAGNKLGRLSAAFVSRVFTLGEYGRNEALAEFADGKSLGDKGVWATLEEARAGIKSIVAPAPITDEILDRQVQHIHEQVLVDTYVKKGLPLKRAEARAKADITGVIEPGPKTKVPTTGPKPGVIAAIVECMRRDNGASIPEIVTELVSRFPERAEKGLTTTARIQVGRWPAKHGATIEKSRDKGRGGTVYKLAS